MNFVRDCFPTAPALSLSSAYTETQPSDQKMVTTGAHERVIFELASRGTARDLFLYLRQARLERAGLSCVRRDEIGQS
jgi:hypothetical protein